MVRIPALLLVFSSLAFAQLPTTSRWSSSRCSSVAPTRGTRDERVGDKRRVLIHRTASNFDQQRDGMTAAESLEDTKIGRYVAGWSRRAALDTAATPAETMTEDAGGGECVI